MSDLISRQAVINVIDEREDVNGNVNAEDIRMDICLIPSNSDKGEWIYDKGIYNWRCSRCGQTPPPTGYVGKPDFMATHFKFCNHCGADMRGEQNGLIAKQKVLATLDFADKALDEDRTVEKYKELLTESIKVLPSAEIKGDLISRQAINDVIEEIKSWYWQADRQALAKDPCVVDAMVDLFIRTIYKHIGKAERGE